jgi:iron complex outermembrane receptor protein
MRYTSGLQFRSILKSGVALAAIALSSAASAQQASPGVSVQLEEISVEVRRAQDAATGPVNGYVAGRSSAGSKTDTPITAVPQSVSVIGRDEIDDRRAVKVDETLLYTAGVSAQSFGPDPDTDWFFIRGFQATQTGVFLDRLPLYAYGFGGFQIDPFLLERVEVLKGPASVLYGGSNPGGIINLVSKRPQNVPFGYAETGINNWGNAYLGFDYNTVDTSGAWSFRFTGRVAGGDQYTDVSEDLRGVVMPQITFQPSAATKFTLYGSYAALDQVRVGGNFLPYVGTVVDSPFGRIDRQAFYGEPSIDDQKRSQFLIGYEFEHAFDTWKVYQNARFGRMTGSQVGPYGYGYYSPTDAPFGNRFEPVGPDYLLYRIGFQERTAVNTFTIDNRATRTFETGFLNHSLMLGLDYKYFNIDHVQASGGATPISVTDPVYGAPQGPAFVYIDQDLSQHQVGFYAQDQLRFGDGWLMTLNGRYDHVDAKSVSAPGLAFSPTYDTKDGALSGRAGLAYEFDNGLTPYVSAATFFNPIFGASPGVGTDPDEPFKPEEGSQIEAGVKYKPTFMDALVTASVFHIVKENVLNPAPTVANPFAQQQLGEVTSTGFEIEGKANITENFKVLASFTAYDLETTEDIRATYVNKTPNVVPEVLASLWLDYTIAEGDFRGLGVGAGVRYTGSSWVDPENTLKVPAATVVDAALRYQRDNWGIALNVTNLFDGEYVKSCQGFSSCGYGESRTVTLSANVKW